MKRRKLLALSVALIMTLVMILTGCGAASGSQGEGETEKAVVEEATGPEDMTSADSGEGLNASVIPGTETTVDTSFILEGKTYTLPMDYSVLVNDGWTTDTDVEQELGGMTYTWLRMEKEGVEGTGIIFDIYNGGGDTKKIKDCKFVSIEMNQSDLENYSFQLPNGLKPGDDEATVKNIMGEPTETIDEDSHLTLKYGKDRNSGMITFYYSKDQELPTKQITIAYFQNEATTSNTAVPDYLSEYKAPSALGDNFDSATIELEGIVYQLPCPVSELSKAGWTLEKDPDVMAGRTEYCYLKKNDMEISCTVNNYADYQTPASNCAVSRLTIDSYSDTDPSPAFALPRDLTEKSTLDEIKTAIAGSGLEFNESSGDGYVSYYYEDYKIGCKASFYIDTEKGRATSVEIKGDQWPGME